MSAASNTTLSPGGMMNDPGKFDALIRRLESLAQSSPGAYRLQLALLGTLGHAFLVLVLAMVAASLALLLFATTEVHALQWVAVQLGWAILIVAAVVLRALWVRIPEPHGIALDRREAPRLYEMLDAVQADLRSPTLHRVLVTYEFNASIAQIPRLGLLGWPRNYLVLGMPFMMGLGPESLRAVVGHELGHLSGNHGAFGAWIYRVRRTWERVLIGLEEQGSKFDFGLRDFFRWYVPYFDAYSFVLARAQEYVADACAAEVTSPGAACATLVEVEVMGAYVSEQLWPSLQARAADEPEPPQGVFRQMRHALGSALPAGPAARLFALAFRRQTGYGDTHPALADRLRALDPDGPIDPRTLEARWSTRVAPRSSSAAEHYLEGALDGLLERMDLGWRESVREAWGHHHRAIQEKRGRLAELDRAAAVRDLTDEEAWIRVSATLDLRGDKAGLAVLEPFVQSHPAHAPSCFLLGRLLLEEGNDTGIEVIERAMRMDPDAFFPGCDVVESHLAAQGRDSDVESWRQRARRLAEDLATARCEREELGPENRFLPHGLSGDALRALVELFTNLPLRRVMLAKKVVEQFPDRPVWAMGISVHARSGLRRSRDIEASVLDRLQEALADSGDFLLFVVEDNPELAEAVGLVDGATILQG